jgi:ferredoxin-NADP reductase
MLTEPLTSPTTKDRQVWYAILAGALFPPQLHIGALYSSPELVLLIGNVFSYAVSPRVRTLLRLKDRIQLTRDSQELIFAPEKPFAFTPGQYAEFTFQHDKTDARGARRFFTIASSPTEPALHLGVKFYEPGSSFKKALLGLDVKTPIVAAQLGGDFTLPKDPKQKVVFIAGGIGITPYRSMLKYMIDTNQKRPTTLVYAARTPEDIVFKDVLETARTKLGTKLLYATGAARVDSEFIKKHIPDYGTCLFYVSGPHGMVVAVEEALRGLGLPHTQIKKDFFSGYA